MLYLINPKRKKGGRMAARKKRATPAQLRALAKARRAKKAKSASRSRAGKKAARTRKRKTTSRRRTTKRTTRRKQPVAARRRRRAPARKRAVRRRRKAVSFRPVKRAYVRNPRFTMKNIGRQLQQGVIDASGVVIGKAATRMVSAFIPFGGQGAMALVKQGVSAVVVGMVASQFIGAQYGRFVLAGGLAAPVETFLQGIPVIGPALTGGQQLGEYLGVAPLPIGEYVEEGTGTPYDMMDEPIGEYVEMFP